jgi:hypothetical protein
LHQAGEYIVRGESEGSSSDGSLASNEPNLTGRTCHRISGGSSSTSRPHDTHNVRVGGIQVTYGAVSLSATGASSLADKASSGALSRGVRRRLTQGSCTGRYSSASGVFEAKHGCGLSALRGMLAAGGVRREKDLKV